MIVLRDEYSVLEYAFLEIQNPPDALRPQKDLPAYQIHRLLELIRLRLVSGSIDTSVEIPKI